MLDKLQISPDPNSFMKLSNAFFRQLKEDGEEELSSYLQDVFFTEEWKHWFAGALPIVGVGRTANPMEAANRSIDQEVIFSIIIYV